jgi:hypothetical protein
VRMPPRPAEFEFTCPRSAAPRARATARVARRSGPRHAGPPAGPLESRRSSRDARNTRALRRSSGDSGHHAAAGKKFAAGFPLCRVRDRGPIPRLTQYARASGPSPRNPAPLKAQLRSPRRKVYATTSSVLATPSGASRAVLWSLVRSTVSSTWGRLPAGGRSSAFGGWCDDPKSRYSCATPRPRRRASCSTWTGWSRTTAAARRPCRWRASTTR